MMEKIGMRERAAPNELINEKLSQEQAVFISC
jgi:hypothetical protein